MSRVTLGTTSLLECSRCDGIWVDVDTLQQICADREKQAFVSSTSSAVDQPLEVEKTIRYVPCPVCHELMNRVQFARCSHVIVDVCKPHGTWFDKDELQRAVQFVRAGGLDKARTQQLEEIKDEQRKLAAERIYKPFFDPAPSNPADDARVKVASSAVGFLFDLLS